jgi:hypothetical protein
MSGLYFLFPTLFAILISFLFVRAASIALMMTGLDKFKARFQALSAFTGTGFTTKEAESVINHPQRRKIIRWLMIMGNANIVTVIVTATSSFSISPGSQLPWNVLILIIGILLIYSLAKYRGFTNKWEHFIEKKLIKSPAFEESAVEDLLHFLKGYGLVKKIILEESPLYGKSVAEAKLNEKGILVLGIERNKVWIPTPKASEIIGAGDHLVIYGPLTILKSKLEDEGTSS